MADVCHLHQVGIQPRLADDVLEQRFVRAMATGCHDHPVQVAVLNRPLNLLLPLFQAGIIHCLDVNHIGQIRSKTSHCVRIHHRRYTRVAAADKNANARLLNRHGALRWKEIGHEGIRPPISFYSQLVGKQSHHIAGRARRVQDRLCDLLGRGERPTDVDAGSARLQGSKFVRRTKAIGVQPNP
jgi:hypothetical protein